MGPMDAIGAPQQILSQGVGGGMGGPGPTLPQSLMPQGAPGLGATGMDPRKIMAYVQALGGNIGGMPGASGGGGGGGGGGFDIMKLPGGPDYNGPGARNPLINPLAFLK